MADTYYGGPEDEHLEAKSLDEYVESYLDDCESDPETIEVAEYRRISKDRAFKGYDGFYLVERFYEELDEEYGNPDDDLPDIPPEVMAKAEELLALIREKYHVWACERIARTTVNVAEWRASRAEGK